jgi:hypothetical protein
MFLRNVTDVYEQIKPIIPNKNLDLINDLDKYIDSLWNIAPELLCRKYHWTLFLHIFNSHSNEIDDETSDNIRKILSNNT